MTLQTLFGGYAGPLIPATDAVNCENAPAYSLSPKQALAQYATTGCFGHAFYASLQDQLKRVLEQCDSVGPEFVAQVAVYSRKRAFMKDMPALLSAWLAANHARLHEDVFGKVIDNAGILRTYVQILRSGVVGRKSLGTAPRRLVRDWLASRSEDELFRASAGQKPSLADIVRMVHPKPATPAREAFYAYLLGKAYAETALPELVRQFEKFKAGETSEVPDLPFTLLSSLPLAQTDWVKIAKSASWQTTRMNLNTFARHGVLNEPEMTELIANRLWDWTEIARARAFPYQLLAAFMNCDATVPERVRDGLQNAMETAIANVPAFEGTVVVCPDVSGSMMSPVTGHRSGASSKVRCIDVAGLIAASVLRKNSGAQILPFHDDVVRLNLQATDTVMTNAARLASMAVGDELQCSFGVVEQGESARRSGGVCFRQPVLG